MPHYPAAVREVLAIEPSDLARRKAAARIHAAPFPVHFAGLDGQRIELDDQSVDGIACTWTLCSIPDVHAALEEMRRVLKPGARLHFFEHGLSLDAKVAASQHRWTPVQKRLFGGCHLDRDIAGLLSAHFPHLAATPKTLRGPRILTTCLHGQAWG
ncbi:MAG: class I SAM-dependent methyltransferase [Planctomycetota bacterium]